MAEHILKTTIQLRRDNTENWTTNKDVIPSAGEPCYDTDAGTLKIGDGVTTYENLSAIHAGEIPATATHYEGVRADDETDMDVIARVIADATEATHQDDIFVVKTLIADNKYSHTAYVYNGTSWVAMDGNYNADNVYFSDDMLVTKEIGYITLTNGQGTIPSKGKNISEVFEAMFVKEQNPTTTQPKVNLTFSQAKAYEVGTAVTPSYTATFDAGKYTYGPETGVTVTSWEISDTDGNTSSDSSGSFDAITVEDDTNYKITAKVNHTEGAIPVTNKKNPYEAGKIAAGSKSATSGAITGYRSFFYGVLDTTSTEAPLTSAIVRGLTNGGAYTGSKTFTLNGSATAKRIVIAIPASSTRSGLKEVILTSAMNTPVTDSYVKTTNAVQVEGVNGATAVDYNVWCYEPASIDAGEVHKITLA
ncbi:MAG: hypothetical protein ACI4XN_12540 [Candidatus Kurthia intestinigallinarum]